MFEDLMLMLAGEFIFLMTMIFLAYMVVGGLISWCLSSAAPKLVRKGAFVMLEDDDIAQTVRSNKFFWIYEERQFFRFIAQIFFVQALRWPANLLDAFAVYRAVSWGTGKPKDKHSHEHLHEVEALMLCNARLKTSRLPHFQEIQRRWALECAACFATFKKAFLDVISV